MGLVEVATIKGNIAYVPIEWTSDASGDAAVVLPDYRGYLFGELITKPDATTPPTDLYDVTLVDKTTGLDILLGHGADRSNANADAPLGIYTNKPILGVMTFTVAHAGHTKKGSAILSLIATKG